MSTMAAVDIVPTMTSPACPLGEYLKQSVDRARNLLCLSGWYAFV